ncbi:MAG: ribulose-phosphate 3-epimerase [Phycisphaeraceae bacterium]
MLDLTKPPSRPLVAASILSADFGRITEECRDVLDRGADLLHIDVMDGHFVPNLTIGVDMVRALRKHLPKVVLDVHMMVEQPDRFIDMFAAAGATVYTFHLEVCAPMGSDGLEVGAMIQRIHDAGMKAGLAVNPPTEPDGLGPWLEHLDLALVMSVNPGRSGQSFIPQVLDKVRWLKERLGPATPGTRLEIDGGINPTTARDAVAAGCDVLVTASALFGADDRSQIIRLLHDAQSGPHSHG